VAAPSASSETGLVFENIETIPHMGRGDIHEACRARLARVTVAATGCGAPCAWVGGGQLAPESRQL
jgi:hypothetical protein